MVVGGWVCVQYDGVDRGGVLDSEEGRLIVFWVLVGEYGVCVSALVIGSSSLLKSRSSKATMVSVGDVRMFAGVSMLAAACESLASSMSLIRSSRSHSLSVPLLWSSLLW